VAAFHGSPGTIGDAAHSSERERRIHRKVGAAQQWLLELSALPWKLSIGQAEARVVEIVLTAFPILAYACKNTSMLPWTSIAHPNSAMAQEARP
jgi:hypothetical protein